MLIKMAAPGPGDYFTFSVGSSVSCTTCLGQNIQGEVVAFDPPSKMLAIKSPSGKGPDRHDVRIVNLALVSHVDVVHECTEPPPALPVLNFQKLEARARHECSEKWKAVNLIGIGVSPEGQKLFNAIHKTISETRWKDKDIVVLDDVVISPPYGLENCKGKEGQALAQVRKIVEKYIKEQQLPQTNSS
ncbi:protein LSM12 homolog A-like [Branchiostoma floridae]|uniref:Protein LSM12 homolog A-like n=1 Tax=Branchiostoma floridae TaxID=7739 RepID=A0A9J7LTT0_BRAFL|nr:protein LSM12 homolog A-like [Branchiostoma floridae]